MTNTLHRYGAPETQRDDYVVFAMPTKANVEGSTPKLKAFLEIAKKYGPVNMGNAKKGGFFRPSEHLTPLAHWHRNGELTPTQLVDGVDTPGVVAAVFDDIDKVTAFLQDLRERDLGMSVNVSGLTDHARRAAEAAGITRHSVEFSLGFCLGQTDRMPDRRTLEIATMCGHGMVSFGLVQKLVQMVKEGRRTSADASRCLARFCSCGVFNVTRAERLFEAARVGR
jgi:hypothetical protein